MTIQINVADKVAQTAGAPVIICGNSDYSIAFVFDAEWDAYAIKTARFVYVSAGAIKYQDVVFEGDTVAVPVLANITEVSVGVYAGNLHTTTPARIPCQRSILCNDPVHVDPPPDVYNQLLELLAKAGSAGNPTGLALGRTDSQVLKTVAGTAAKIEEE